MDGGAWCRLLSMGSQRVGHDWVTLLFLPSPNTARRHILREQMTASFSLPTLSWEATSCVLYSETQSIHLIFLMFYLFIWLHQDLLSWTTRSFVLASRFFVPEGSWIVTQVLSAPRHVGSQFPDQGCTYFPALEAGFLTTGSPRKSQNLYVYNNLHYLQNNLIIYISSINFFLICRHIYLTPRLTLTLVFPKLFMSKIKVIRSLGKCPSLLAMSQRMFQLVLSCPSRNCGKGLLHICLLHLSHPINYQVQMDSTF